MTEQQAAGCVLALMVLGGAFALGILVGVLL